MAVLVLSLGPFGRFASALYGTKIIDGNLSDWTVSDLIAVGQDNGQAGANLDKMYVSWDDQYLYIAIKTSNTQSWDVAYGIGIDVDPGTGNGYVSGGDSWGRSIEFSNGFALDYEIYFWWGWNSGMGTDNFNTWTGSGWNYNSISSVGGSFAYTGDTSTGLQTVEIKIPWSALGGKPERIAVMAWVTGGGGSAVDSLPVDPAIDYTNIGAEWGDTDTFTNMAVIYVAPKTIDGNLSDWSNADLLVAGRDNGQAGANLDRMYVSWDDQYLYIAIKTNNTGSWDVAYGIGIDIDPGTGNGYTTGTDSWGRSVEFSGGFALDYELYFWWGWNSGMGTDNFNTWTGSGWNYKSLADVGAKFAYTGDTSTGLQTLEIAIPWSALGGKHSRFAVMSWVTGGGGSAVDSLPVDPAIDYTNIGAEWGDTDTFTNMLVGEWFLMPDLTVSVTGPGVVGINRLGVYNVTVKNEGSLPVSNASVRVYLGGNLYTNWTVNLNAGESKWFLFNWSPNATGTYTIRAVVDEENAIPEANENNNEFTMDVQVVWVGSIDVDGNPDDWPAVSIAPNSYTVQNGVFIWSDATNDQKHDKDQWLPGGTSAHADLTEVGVTKDDRYVYFLFRFANMSNIKIGDNGATFIAVPIDYKDGGATWFAGEMDTNGVLQWDIQMAINLGGSQYTGQTSAVVSSGTGKTSLLYFVDPAGNIVQVSGALVGVNLHKNTVEVRIPLSVFGGAKEFSFQVATGFSYGPAVWNFGDPFANDGISDIVDTITKEPSTTEELSDNIPDYYIRIRMDNIVESATLVSVKMQRLIQYQNSFVMLNRFYGIRHFERDYAAYSDLLEKLNGMPLTDDMKDRLNELRNKVMDLLKLYNEGKELIDSPNYAFGASLKIYRAYTGMKKIVREMESMVEKAQSGELEREKHMQELAKNLTKTIDGNLDDWNVQPIAVDDTGYGQDGANLKALYVDYDDQFLYIALTTENKASWRVAYGIAMDYKDGGYTTGTDAWGRKVSFDKGIDAQLYFFWNGEFFGDKGTSNITSAQFVVWDGSAWKYEELKWVGFYAYTGGAENGLQTLEIAIPWEALGGKPEKLSMVAYVTGQGAGDSAVDSLPLQDAVRDKAPGEEWGDEDTFTKFATVTIE
ncbi:CARDB domain-containing protein [Thermococcus thioreducens]